MSIIYSLPTTIIQTNGSRVYKLKTRDYDGILHAVEVESKTSDTINLDFEDLYFQSIAFKGNSDLGETTLKCIRETLDVKNYYLVDSRPLTCDNSLKEEYLPELQFLISKGYVIDIPMPGFATLDLNNQWRRSQTYESPLEGYTLFESASNWHVGSGVAKCFMDVDRYEGTFYYIAYGESNYDRLFMVGPHGETFVFPNSASPDNLSNYKSTTFIDGRWTITYEKDSSVDQNADRGYILLPNDIQYSNEYVEPVPEPIYIQSMNIFGAESIKTEGTVEYFASIFPVEADTYNLGWYIDEAPTGVVARIRWTADNPKYAYLEVDSIDEGVDSELTIVCYDDVSGVEQSYSIRIYKEAVPIHIQNITISGPSQITEAGVYDYYASYSPDNADEYDIDWSFVSGFTEEHIALQTDPSNPFHAQLVVSQPDASFSAAFAIECEDTVSHKYNRYSVVVDVYVQPVIPVITSITVSGPSSITEIGDYDFYADIYPADAPFDNIRWVGSSEGYAINFEVDQNNPKHCILHVVDYVEYNNYQLYCINDDPYVYGYKQFNIEAKWPEP